MDNSASNNDENDKVTSVPSDVDPVSSPKDAPVQLKLGSASAASQMSHRQSITEQLRAPPSPRSQRQSFSQGVAQQLVDRPPAANKSDPTFAGRDWRTICVGELTDKSDVAFVEPDIDVEAATQLLVDSRPAVVLIRDSKDNDTLCGTFDFNDLNTYLLFVVGLIRPSPDDVGFVEQIVSKARSGGKVTIRSVRDLSGKEPFVTLPHTADLTKAVELFGSGIHRIVILKEGTSEAIGVLSQLRLVKFLWENGKSFPSLDSLYPQYLRGLSIGSHMVISINGDRPLSEALLLLNNEGVSSLAVVDNSMNVVGNISTVDVKLLTNSSSAPLLEQSCLHFISVILNERGLMDGKDSVPVFYVNPYSTLAHTIAKLVATRAHRMWIVDSPSPSPASSIPATPLSSSGMAMPPSPQMPPSPGVPWPSTAALPGSTMSGKLTGVVSLTDVLNLYARQTGLSPSDPNQTRRQRRRSSSSSVQGRASVDGVRSTSMDLRR